MDITRIAYSNVHAFETWAAFYLMMKNIWKADRLRYTHWAIGHIPHIRTRSHPNSEVNVWRGPSVLALETDRKHETANRLLFVICRLLFAEFLLSVICRWLPVESVRADWFVGDCQLRVSGLTGLSVIASRECPGWLACQRDLNGHPVCCYTGYIVECSKLGDGWQVDV